jgi:hypothetical protein
MPEEHAKITEHFGVVRTPAPEPGPEPKPDPDPEHPLTVDSQIRLAQLDAEENRK